MPSRRKGGSRKWDQDYILWEFQPANERNFVNPVTGAFLVLRLPLRLRNRHFFLKAVSFSYGVAYCPSKK